MSTVSFLSQLDPVPIDCSPLTCDINGFKSRINRHLLTAGSFETCFQYALKIKWSFWASFSSNSKHGSGCSVLHGVNPN